MVADIRPIAEIVQRTGVPIECCAFIGSSPIRQYAEGWTLEFLQKTTEEAIGFAVKQGLTVMYVTEDTTRADPDSLRALFTTALRAGRLAPVHRRHGRPRDAARRAGRGPIRPEPGRRARRRTPASTGTATATAGSASPTRWRRCEAGATRLHGAALGIGERCGNTPMDLLLVNLVMMGCHRTRSDDAAGVLRGGLARVRRADSRRISRRRPRRVPHRHRRARGGGREGVRKRDRALMDAVYAAVPASLVGREQEIDVGPMSGKSNVIFWLERRGLPATDEIVDRIFSAAKASKRTLTPEQIQKIIKEAEELRN